MCCGRDPRPSSGAGNSGATGTAQRGREKFRLTPLTGQPREYDTRPEAEAAQEQLGGEIKRVVVT